MRPSFVIQPFKINIYYSREWKTSERILKKFTSLNKGSFYVCDMPQIQLIFANLSHTLREKCPNTEYFLVRIFLYSGWIQESTDQKKNSVFVHFSCSDIIKLLNDPIKLLSLLTFIPNKKGRRKSSAWYTIYTFIPIK